MELESERERGERDLIPRERSEKGFNWLLIYSCRPHEATEPFT